jgi:hypothetical protein
MWNCSVNWLMTVSMIWRAPLTSRRSGGEVGWRALRRGKVMRRTRLSAHKRVASGALIKALSPTASRSVCAAPLIATSLTLSVTNAAAVSLGSLCAAGRVLFTRVVLNDPEGNPVETASCCVCGAVSGSGLPGAEAACRARRPVQIAFDPSHPVECPNARVGEVIRDCFARCDAVP